MDGLFKKITIGEFSDKNLHWIIWGNHLQKRLFLIISDCLQELKTIILPLYKNSANSAD